MVVIKVDVGSAVDDASMSFVDGVDILPVVRNVGVTSFGDDVGVDIVVGVDTDMEVDSSGVVSIFFAVVVKEEEEVGDVEELDAATDVDGSNLIVVFGKVKDVDELGIVFVVEDVCVSRVVAGVVFVILVDTAEVFFTVDALDVVNRVEDGTVVIVSVVDDVNIAAEEVGVDIIKVGVCGVTVVIKVVVCVSDEAEVVNACSHVPSLL